jgi:hypothetical protein
MLLARIAIGCVFVVTTNTRPMAMSAGSATGQMFSPASAAAAMRTALLATPAMSQAPGKGMPYRAEQLATGGLQLPLQADMIG